MIFQTNQLQYTMSKSEQDADKQGKTAARLVQGFPPRKQQSDCLVGIGRVRLRRSVFINPGTILLLFVLGGTNNFLYAYVSK